MKALLITLSILLSGVCYGQVTNETDSIRLNKERKEQLLNNYKPGNGEHPLDRKSAIRDTPDKTEYSFDENAQVSDLNISIPKYYEGPLYEYTAAPSINPYTDDYSFYKRNTVMDGGWINTTSSHSSYPGLGSLTMITANYEYLLSDRIIASVGTYGARYFYNTTMNTDFGINASLNYKVNNNLSLMGFGQYSARGNINKVGGDNAWMMPGTYYGAGARYMFNTTFGVEGGIKRELNPMTGKWRNIPYISPVIRIK